MPPMTVRSFVSGPPAYGVLGNLKLYWTLPIALVIFLGWQALAVAVYVVTGGNLADLVPATPIAGGPSSGPRVTLVELQITLIAQFGVIVFTVLAACFGGAGLISNLRLGPPEGGLWAYVWAIALMIPLILVMNAVTYLARPADFLADFKIFLDTARSNRPTVVALAICLGAPLSEELLFRGYLLASATATRIPYWIAAIAVTLIWTLLHLQYSILGIIEVFVIGIFLSWVLWRTGSLRVPLVCHAAYNTILFLIMRYLPLPI